MSDDHQNLRIGLSIVGAGAVFVALLSYLPFHFGGPKMAALYGLVSALVLLFIYVLGVHYPLMRSIRKWWRKK